MSSRTWSSCDGPTRATLAGGVVIALLLAVVAAVAPSSPARAAATGELVWGVKQSFRSYVTGPIAHGAIATSAGASTRDGVFVFPQSASTATDPAGPGTTSFSGAVRFTGHGGQLDTTFSAPRIVVAADGTARLSVETTGQGRVDMAELSGRSRSGDVTTWSTVLLTETGTAVFALDGSSFYAAGTPLDPVSARVSVGADPEPSATAPTSPEPTATSPSPTTPAPSVTPTRTPTKPAASTGSRRAGELVWGVKESFRSYVTGPVARGSVAVSGGATATNGGYRFGQATTTADPPSARGTTTYRGAVSFDGHAGLLSLTFSAPHVRVTSSRTAVLSVVVAGRGRLDVADLTLAGGTRSAAARAVSYSGVPATLTAAGSSLFSYRGSSFYPAGTTLDPVSFVVGGTAPPVASTSSAVVASVGTARSGAARAPQAAAAADSPPIAGCPVDDASLSWGFKESFRSYVSGSIANGDWTTRGGASYATPVFSFGRGEGTFDSSSRSGQVAWKGAIEFTGHDGVLDTTVSNPRLRLTSATSATLVLDVRGVSMDDAMAGKDTQVTRKAVPFVTLDLGAAPLEKAGGRLVARDVGTTLTPQGHDAFPNYEAGTAFDPVDVSFAVPSDCAVVSSSASAGPDARTASVQDVTSTSGQGWVPWVAGGAIGVVLTLLVGGVGFLLGRRGRTVA